MKFRLMSTMFTAVLAFSVIGSNANAGVAEKTYSVQGVSTALEFIEDVFSFDDEDVLTTSLGEGEYDQIFDLGVFSYFSATIVDSEADLEINLIGIQIQGILLSRGSDTDGIQYYLLGQEVIEE